MENTDRYVAITKQEEIKGGRVVGWADEVDRREQYWDILPYQALAFFRANFDRWDAKNNYDMTACKKVILWVGPENWMDYAPVCAVVDFLRDCAEV